MLGAAGAALARSGPHGGILDGEGPLQVELVISRTHLTAYLLENGKPSTSKGATLSAVIREGTTITTLTFADQNGKRLIARLPRSLAVLESAVIDLMGKSPRGEAIRASYRFK